MLFYKKYNKKELNLIGIKPNKKTVYLLYKITTNNVSGMISITHYKRVLQVLMIISIINP
jgi:hypothetical protein